MKVFDKILNVFKKAMTRLFGKNLALKILSVFFAIILWGYVIAEVNPLRTKVIENVPVRFEGDTDLYARGLVVRGFRTLQDVTVSVSTELANYADLSATNISAYINLRDIFTTNDSYRARVIVTSNIGTVESVSPQYIDLEIDNYTNKIIPLEAQLVGQIEEGYWNGTPELSASTVQVSGAAKDVNRVTRAVVQIPLTNRTTSYNDAFNVVYLDSNGEEVDSGYFIGEAPAVTVRMDILPKKTVTVDYESALLGADRLPSNYEIAEVKAKPDTVEIAAPADVLEEIDSISFTGSVNLAGSTQPILEALPFNVPEGVVLLGNQIGELYVNIQEKNLTALFHRQVQPVNLGKNLEVSFIGLSEMPIEVQGQITKMSHLRESHIHVTVDLKNLGEGVYTLPVELEFEDSSLQNELQYTMGHNKVTIKITRK